MRADLVVRMSAGAWRPAAALSALVLALLVGAMAAGAADPPGARRGLQYSSGYRQVLPFAGRGTNLTATTFAPISVTVPPVATAVTTSDRSVTRSLPAGVALGADGRPATVTLSMASAAAPETTSVGGLRAVDITMRREDGAAVTQLARPIE